MLRSFIRKSPLIRGGRAWSRCAYFLQTLSDRSYTICTNSEFSQDTESDTSSITQQNESNIIERLSANPEVEKKENNFKMPTFKVMDRHAENLYRRYLLTPDQPDNPRILRVAIIGAPNAGKSTLINSLVGWKLNSVSKKVHTTRQNANTMFNIDNAQIIFVDTPGVLSRTEKKRYLCEGKMLSEPQRGVEEADIVGVVVDVSNKWTRNQLHLELLKVLYLHRDIPSFLILNKIDSVRGDSLVKQQTFLLDVTKRLSDGNIGGKKFGRSKIQRIKEKKTKPKNFYDMLEQKYGKIEKKECVRDVGHSKIELDDSSENLEKQFLEKNEKKVKDYLTTWLQVDFKAKGVDGIKAKLDRSEKPDSWSKAEEKIISDHDNSENLERELLKLFDQHQGGVNDSSPRYSSESEVDDNRSERKDKFRDMKNKTVELRAKRDDGVKANKLKKTDSWNKTEDRTLLKLDDSENLKMELLEMFKQHRCKDEVPEGSSAQEMHSVDSDMGHISEPELDDTTPVINDSSEGIENETVQYDMNMSSNVDDQEKLASIDNDGDDCDEEVGNKTDSDDITDMSTGELSKMETANIVEDESDDKIVNIELENSYQSEYLTRILSRPCEVISDDAKDKREERHKMEISKEVLEVKEAINAVKNKFGWSGFDQVFPVSALDGQGIDSLKEYLLKMSKPGDWVYHSSIVTDQHPVELARLCITQSLLDYVESSYLPYIIKPVITYWDVDDYNRLNISVDVILKNGYEMKQILGSNTSERVTNITRSARQALMDAFQCEVRFKLSVKMQKKRGSSK